MLESMVYSIETTWDRLRLWVWVRVLNRLDKFFTRELLGVDLQVHSCHICANLSPLLKLRATPLVTPKWGWHCCWRISKVSLDANCCWPTRHWSNGETWHASNHSYDSYGLIRISCWYFRFADFQQVRSYAVKTVAIFLRSQKPSIQSCAESSTRFEKNLVQLDPNFILNIEASDTVAVSASKTKCGAAKQAPKLTRKWPLRNHVKRKILLHFRTACERDLNAFWTLLNGYGFERVRVRKNVACFYGFEQVWTLVSYWGYISAVNLDSRAYFFIWLSKFQISRRCYRRNLNTIKSSILGPTR